VAISHELTLDHVPECLVGLLLAVAGVLTHDQIAAFEVGADLLQVEAEEGLDQRAGVARQVAFGVLCAEIGSCAQPHVNAIFREHQLFGHEHAK
jgi:hypothetical protein